MKAWFWVKVAATVVGVGLVFLLGLAIGSTSSDGEVAEVQLQQLENCIPIESTEALSKCTGVKFVGGQQ